MVLGCWARALRTGLGVGAGVGVGAGGGAVPRAGERNNGGVARAGRRKKVGVAGFGVGRGLDARLGLGPALGKRKEERVKEEKGKRKRESGKQSKAENREQRKRKSGKGKKKGKQKTSLSRAWLPDESGCCSTSFTAASKGKLPDATGCFDTSFKAALKSLTSKFKIQQQVMVFFLSFFRAFTLQVSNGAKCPFVAEGCPCGSNGQKSHGVNTI